MSMAKAIAERQAEHEVALPSADEVWPDRHSRLIFEAQMLRHHAETLEARYPETIWPNSGSVQGSERDMHAAQAAFVAGIRFAANQLHGAVAEINDAIYAIEQAVSS
jgi:hypothetical protein